MRTRRATQVDRQVGQSGQLGHNQHSRAPSSTSIVSPDTTPTSRSLGHRVISSFVRVPARLEMSSEATLVSFALQKQKQENEFTENEFTENGFPRTIQMIEKGKTHTRTTTERDEPYYEPTSETQAARRSDSRYRNTRSSRHTRRGECTAW
jgi:hypothetical protein